MATGFLLTVVAMFLRLVDGHKFIDLTLCLTVLFLTLAPLTAFSSLKETSSDKTPLANATGSLVSRYQAARSFVKCSRETLSQARERFPNIPFRLLTDWGELLILPGVFADEIRNDRRLSFTEAATKDNHAGVPGFETIHLIGRIDQPIQIVTRKYLAKKTSAIIEPMSRETSLAVALNFGTSTDWHEIRVKPAILDIIARISSRVQLGEKLCRNEEWLRIAKTYTTAFYTASTELRAFPRVLRCLAHWLLPSCQHLRHELRKAQQIIAPLIQYRQELRKEAAAKGISPPRFNDAIDWADEQAAKTGLGFDPAIFQLTLSLLSIHTTYDLLQQTMVELARNPQYIEPLRQEVLHVLTTEGWKPTAFAKMRLLDSAIKEAQRLKPGSIVTMRRYVLQEMTLSNGIVLKKGSRLNVDTRRMSDPEVYSDPSTYNPYRFLDMREQPEKKHMAHLVSTSSLHLGFGHGQHACPGRFFAANEIKMALCHMLIKYDWMLVPKTNLVPDTRGMVSKSSPETEMLVRLRSNPEIDLDVLGEVWWQSV